MTGGTGLERGYRRLLACYPRRFRDEHGEELLGVLLASTSDGQHRPGLLESADLVWNGLGMRLHLDNSRSARARAGRMRWPPTAWSARCSCSSPPSPASSSSCR